jgi:hypothetical protein
MEISDKIVAVVLKQMPLHAEHYQTESTFEGIVLGVHWKLKNDPNRPNKYSKTIIIFLSCELLEDFPNYPQSMQDAALAKIENGIRDRLKTFDPNHTHSRYEQPPTVHWKISTEEIFG